MTQFLKLPRLGYYAAQDKMLITFVDAIDNKVRLLCLSSKNDDSCPEAIREIKDLIKSIKEAKRGDLDINRAWAEAYRLEGMMIAVEPAQNLFSELRLRLEELAAEGSSAAPRLRSAIELAETRALDRTTNPPALRSGEETSVRALLLTTLNELHWTKQRKFFSRPIQKSATRRIVWAGIVSFILFMLPYIFYFYDRLYNSPPKYLNAYIGLPFYTSLTAGLFSAYFSRLMYMQSNAINLSIGELKAAREWTSIFLRARLRRELPSAASV